MHTPAHVSDSLGLYYDMLSNLTIVSAKKELRKLIRERLRAVLQDSIKNQSNNVVSSVLRTTQFEKSKSVALYMSMQTEVQTLDLIRSCFDMNKEVYLPRCNTIFLEGRKRNFLSMLKIKSYEDILRLPQGNYNLLEPLDGEDVMDKGHLDLVILPGLAFTKEKSRLGQGAGFYDTFLNMYYQRFGQCPYLMGIGLREQLVEFVPTDVHDWLLDCVVIDDMNVFY